jgi:hypothetical protein
MNEHAHPHQPVPHEPAWLQRFLTLVFIRDWHPVLRDPLDLFRLSFPIGALIFAILGDWDAVVRLLLPGLAVFAVRALDIPRPVDWVFCFAMFFQGWGNALHLFSEFWWYDNSVHITLPMSLAPILSSASPAWTSCPTPPSVPPAPRSCSAWRSSRCASA